MPGRITELSETQIIADLLRAKQRQARALAISQTPQPAKDTLTIASSGAPATWQLNAIPYQGAGGSSLNLSLNGVELLEGVDYTVDYTTAIVTFSAGTQAAFKATPTPADVLTADYWTTGDLIAASGPVDIGIGPATYVSNTATSGTGSTASAPMPTGLAAGDLMLLFLNTNNASSVTTPSGWTLLGAPAAGILAVWSKIAGSSEPTVSLGLPSSQGWSTQVRAYRGTSVAVQASGFNTASSVSSLALPSLSVSGNPTMVEVWAVFKGFSVNPITSVPGTMVNNVWTPNVTLGIETGDEPLSGVTTTPSRSASATGGDDTWNGAMILVQTS